MEWTQFNGAGALTGTAKQVKINGNELRVDGKKKDDLQTVMNMIENSKIGIPVQFINFRD